jgi:hypothetical protein
MQTTIQCDTTMPTHDAMRSQTRLGNSGDQLPAIAALRKLEPEKLAKTVRGELDWIAMKALEKARSRRYETANGWAVTIQMDGPPNTPKHAKTNDGS